jgi:hypothetical protein
MNPETSNDSNEGILSRSLELSPARAKGFLHTEVTEQELCGSHLLIRLKTHHHNGAFKLGFWVFPRDDSHQPFAFLLLYQD